MAEMCIAYNTNEKKLKVTRDGQEIPNVTSVHAGRAYNHSDPAKDEHRMEITQHHHDAEHDTHEYHRLVASEMATAAEAAAGTEAKMAPGFIVLATNSDVEADVQNYFKSEPKKDKK